MIDSTLFKNATLVLPNGIKQGDIFIQNGKIQKLGPSLSNSAELEIDAKGLVIMPGMIDSHVHFREPGPTYKETIETGSRAAVSGGVTSFFEMPNTNPSTTTIEEMANKKHIASQTSLANYAFYIGATPDNLEILNSVENVPGIKIYVGSSTGSLLVADRDQLIPIFENGDRIISVHSEDEQMVQESTQQFAGSTTPSDHYCIRSTEAAIKCTKMLHGLANDYKRRLHILHLTTADEVRFLRENPSAYVTSEVCPHHLSLYGPDAYDRLGNLVKVNPPIREKHHTDELWKGLLDGTIDCIGSDHAPHTLEDKDKPFMEAPSGMPLVEMSVRLLLHYMNQGRFTLSQLSHWISAKPAQLFGIQSKGILKQGFDADLCIVDTNSTYTVSRSSIVSKAGWSVFEGSELKGNVLMTMVNGQLVYREGDILDSIKAKEIQFS